MPGWLCQWKPFWIPVWESFKKAHLEGDDSSDEQGVTNFPPPCPRIRPAIGNELRHHCLLYGPDATSSTQKQLSPFPERLELPFSSDEILSGYEEIVSSGTDQFTAWVKMDPHDVLVHHMVDVQKATADFREASEKEACCVFSDNTCQQKFIQSFTCAEAAQHLQLEPRAPSRKGRCP